MAPHSSTLAWKIPWTEEPGGLQSTGSIRVGHDWATSLSLFTFTFHFHALEKEMATCSSVLAWRIPGTGKPGGLPSLGSHRVGHDWSNLVAAAAYSSVLHNLCPTGYHSKLNIQDLSLRSSFVPKRLCDLRDSTSLLGSGLFCVILMGWQKYTCYVASLDPCI